MYYHLLLCIYCFLVFVIGLKFQTKCSNQSEPTYCCFEPISLAPVAFNPCLTPVACFPAKGAGYSFPHTVLIGSLNWPLWFIRVITCDNFGFSSKTDNITRKCCKQFMVFTWLYIYILCSSLFFIQKKEQAIHRCGYRDFYQLCSLTNLNWTILV